MAKTLVIVESPTKSKTIEKFLGKNYTVKASMGHLRDLPKSTLGVTFLPDEEHANEFEPKYINIRGKGDLIKSLKAEAKKAVFCGQPYKFCFGSTQYGAAAGSFNCPQ